MLMTLPDQKCQLICLQRPLYIYLSEAMFNKSEAMFNKPMINTEAEVELIAGITLPAAAIDIPAVKTDKTTGPVH